jgi:hypothetical protein
MSAEGCRYIARGIVTERPRLPLQAWCAPLCAYRARSALPDAPCIHRLVLCCGFSYAYSPASGTHGPCVTASMHHAKAIRNRCTIHVRRKHAPSPSITAPITSFFGPFGTVRRLMAASAKHSSSSLRSQAMQPPPPSPGLRHKAAIGAADNDGGNYESAYDN